VYKLRLFSVGLFIGFTALSGPTFGQDGFIKASCIQGGRLVYREDLPRNIPADKRLQIAANYPQALCAFMLTEPTPSATIEPGPPIPSGLASSASGDGLESALAYLGADQGAVGTPYGEVFDQAMDDFMKSENSFSSPEGTVNLTIGIYRDTKSEDVLAHWAEMQKNSPILSSMTPSIQTVEDVTVLNIEDVADSQANDVCKAADEFASGCIAVY
jgi:hypothetical protein